MINHIMINHKSRFTWGGVGVRGVRGGKGGGWWGYVVYMMD